MIESLYFQDIRRRIDQVPSADQFSNDWIYDVGLTTFIPWLQSSAKDACLFYIHEKVRELLFTILTIPN